MLPGLIDTAARRFAGISEAAPGPWFDGKIKQRSYVDEMGELLVSSTAFIGPRSYVEHDTGRQTIRQETSRARMLEARGSDPAERGLSFEGLRNALGYMEEGPVWLGGAAVLVRVDEAIDIPHNLGGFVRRHKGPSRTQRVDFGATGAVWRAEGWRLRIYDKRAEKRKRDGPDHWRIEVSVMGSSRVADWGYEIENEKVNPIGNAMLETIEGQAAEWLSKTMVKAKANLRTFAEYCGERHPEIVEEYLQECRAGNVRNVARLEKLMRYTL